MQLRTMNTRKLRKGYNFILNSGIDFSFLFILLFMLAFGLLMIYSASSYVAMRNFGDEAHYFKRQLLADGLGIIGMIVLTFIPYTLWMRAAIVEYVVAAALIVLVIPFGTSSHGAARWITIPGIGLNFQPAEAAKLFMILFLAFMVHRLGKDVSTTRSFGILMLCPIPICALIYFITDNLSSALIIFMIAFAMSFVGSRDYKKYILIGLGVLALAGGVVAYVAASGTNKQSSFRLGRIAAWIHPEASSETTARQTIQGLYAIGNGGLWGQGLGQSVQKISQVPEPHNDMIFSIICEELGLVGAAALIFLFVFLLWKMYMIARRTRNRYGFMIVVGVMFHIALQAILNIGVATNSIPNTGVSLPFISYGGSSVLFLLAEMGLVMSVHRQNVLEDAE